MAIAARRTAGDLSANAICISSSGLPPLLRRSASSAARRTCCEASFLSIASSAGAAPAAPLRPAASASATFTFSVASAGIDASIRSTAARAAAPSRGVVDAGCTANGAR